MAFASSAAAFASNSLGGFGTQPQGQNTTQGSTLFGSTAGQNTQQQQGQQGQAPSLFGGGGGFGQTQQSQPQQQQQPSLFGQPAPNSQQQQPSLFGQTASNSQQQSTLGSSLFGNTQGQQNNQPQQQQQQQGASRSLFGNANAGSTLGQSTGFGSWGQAQPNQPSNTFGSSLLGTNNSSFLGPTPQQSHIALNTQGAPPFTKSTKFNDLPDEYKRVLENIDSFIQGRVQISNDIKQRKLGEEAVKGQEDVRAVHKRHNTLHSDVHHTRDLKSRVDQTVQDTIQNGVHLRIMPTSPEFFNRWYKSTIEQIERKLQYTPQSITSTLEAQHSTFIALASKTAALDAELQKIKTLYTQLWRARTGSMRDPFNDLDRASGGEFGIEG
ncbi:hypothetical protein B0H21DRAFT_745496 [Amylocystis lapponica]|nr:hypothetical protein B0H21DRAFT_745496 [Amylocystis lapponica]